MCKSIIRRERVLTGRVRAHAALWWLTLAISVLLMVGSSKAGETAHCFCTGKIGNINCDPLDEVTLGDAMRLVDHLFISGAELPGLEEANIDQDSAGVIDINDVMLLFWYLFVTDEELPDCPEPKDYTVYFWDGDSMGWYFGYHPSTNRIDSFFIPGRGSLVVSADGKLGFLSFGITTSVRVVSFDSLQNGDTLQALDSYPWGPVLAFSPDGRLVASYKNGLSVRRVSDQTEIFHDSALVGTVFSANSERVYGRTVQGYRAFMLDLSDSLHPVTIKEFPGSVVYQIVPSPDETKWYLYMATYFHQLFAVYDVEADSIVFSEAMWPGSGELAVTPNGDYVFFTNPGNMADGPGDYDVRVYESASNTVIKRVSTYGVFEEQPDEGAFLDFLSATPDSRWVVMLSAHYPYAVLAMDTRTMVFTNYRCLEGPKTLDGLTCPLMR